MPRNASVVAGGTAAVLMLGVAAAAAFSEHHPDRGPVGVPLVVTAAPEIDPAPRTTRTEDAVAAPELEAPGTLETATAVPDGPEGLVPTSRSGDEPGSQTPRDGTDGRSEGGGQTPPPSTDWWTAPTEPWWTPPADGWWVPDGVSRSKTPTPTPTPLAPSTGTSPAFAPASPTSATPTPSAGPTPSASPTWTVTR